MLNDVRWIAEVTYNAEAGDVDVTHHMLELAELHQLIEKGPSWECIKSISVTYARREGESVKSLDEASGQ